ncbi:hypothetical protein RvY_08090 [Ramazzottius varieornatus]|uniref:Uncharacterized protein n=1 Tax=Ramazzottius varieornatus TaxID=947166 RepID=A0A1D1VDT9_RAMVA|nr:hypothetical protein RvY_08090 [Ramazzottius varieornatus]
MPGLKWLCCIPRKRRKSIVKASRTLQEDTSLVPHLSGNVHQQAITIPESIRRPDLMVAPCGSATAELPAINKSMPNIPPEMQTKQHEMEIGCLLADDHQSSGFVSEILPTIPIHPCSTEKTSAEFENKQGNEANSEVKMEEGLKNSPVRIENNFEDKNAWSNELTPKCRRPRSLIAFTTSPIFPKKTRNDLLTPEILQDPEALAALGFGYPSGYGPPYPPLPLDIALSLDTQHRRIISPHDLEVHEACSTSCSVSSGFSSGDRRDSLLEESHNGTVERVSGENSPSSSDTKEHAEETREDLQKTSDANLWWMMSGQPVEVPNAKAVLDIAKTYSQEIWCDKSDLQCTVMLFAALRIPCDIDKVLSLPVVRPEPWISDIADYALARVVGGQTPRELIQNISELSDAAIYGRFFSTSPLPDVDLQRFLSVWIRKSVIPVLCLNFQWLSGEQSRSLGVEGDSTWQYRVVSSVLPNEGRTRLLAPLCDVTAMQLLQWLDTPKTQLISPDNLLYGLNHEDSRLRRREAGHLSVLRHLDDGLNVLGQVVYLLEIENSDNEMRFGQDVLSRQDGRVRPRMVPQILDVVAPTRMENGILLFARQDNAEVCDLIRNLNTPLRDLYA